MVRCVGSGLLVMLFGAGCDSVSKPRAQARDAGAVQPRDGAPSDEQEAMALGVECDPVAPTCAADEKCTNTRIRIEAGWPAPRCTKDPGSAGLGEREACFSEPGAYDFCGTGLSCTNFGSGEGFCIRQCSVLGTTCAVGEVCAPVDPNFGFKLCLPSCTKTEDCEYAGIFECVTQAGVSYCDVTMDR